MFKRYWKSGPKRAKNRVDSIPQENSEILLECSTKLGRLEDVKHDKKMDSSGALDNISGITYSDEQLLKERGYQFIKQLGEGSYAKVYLTNHSNSGKPSTTLACKVINAKKAPREYVTKFLPRELDIIGKVTHPNIIHTDAIFHRNNKFLIFMRYAENGDMLEYILRKGEVKENIAKVWLYQLTLAIQYLHTLDIAHRDIKCENILISANYNIKLADFGFARFVSQNGKPILSSTYCGSLIYASPEILKGKPYYPKCADIWSLGIVMYIMLNKTMPFSEANTRQLYKLQMAQQWSFRSKIAPTLSTHLMVLVAKMLEPNFKARVIIEEIAYDQYFQFNRLQMTETEKIALDIAKKHKYTMQELKKIVIPSSTLFVAEESSEAPSNTAASSASGGQIVTPEIKKENSRDAQGVSQVEPQDPDPPERKDVTLSRETTLEKDVSTLA